MNLNQHLSIGGNAQQCQIVCGSAIALYTSSAKAACRCMIRHALCVWRSEIAHWSERGAPRLDRRERMGLNQQMIRRLGRVTTMTAFALVVLAACGEQPSEEVTRVPVTSEAAGEPTGCE